VKPRTRPTADQVDTYIRDRLALDLADMDCLSTAMVLEVPGALLEKYRGVELEQVEFSFAGKRSLMLRTAVLRSMRQAGLGSARRLTNYLGFKVGPNGDRLLMFDPLAEDVVLSDVLPGFHIPVEVLRMMTWNVRNPGPNDPAVVSVYDALLHLNVHANRRVAHPGLPHSEHENADWTKYFLGSAFLLSTVVYFTFVERDIPIPSNVLDWSKTILPSDLFDEYQLWISGELPSMIKEKMLLVEHLPYRLGVLDALSVFTLFQYKTNPSATGQLVEDSFRIQTHGGDKDASVLMLYALAIESGLPTFRMLLQFLGLTNEGKDKLVEARVQKDDVVVSILNMGEQQTVPKVTPQDIRSIPPLKREDLAIGIDIPSFEELLAYTSRCASKASAHMTSISKPAPYTRWYDAAITLQAILRVWVYERLGVPLPSGMFDCWTQSLLHGELREVRDERLTVVTDHIREHFHSTIPELQPRAIAP